MLNREHLAGTSEAALDLIDNEQNAMLVADLAELAQEIEGRDVEAALALHRLDHHGGDPRGLDVRLEQELERTERILRGHVVELVRIGDVINLAREGAEAALIGIDLAGERHGHERAAVEAADEGDDRRTLGGIAGDLNRVLNRFRAGGEEDGLVRALAGRETVQLLRERDIGLVGRHLETGVCEALELRLYRLHYLGMTVPGV